MPFNSSTHGLLLQQGRLQEGRPRPRTSRPKTWPEVGAAAGEAEGRAAHTCAVHHRLAVAGCSSRASRAWHNVAVRDQAERLRRPRHAARVQRRRCRCSHIQNLAEHGQDRASSSTRAARTSRRRSSPRGECAMITDLGGSYAQHQGERQVRLRRRAAAVLRRRRRARRRTRSSAARACG